MMRQLICRWCHGRCDPGDLVDGVCLDCLEAERQRQERSRTVVRIMNSPCYQMELNLGGHK